MSSWLTTNIECDACNCVSEYDGDLHDADYAWGNDGGVIDVEVDGDYYNHVCESCTDDMYGCDWCEDGRSWDGYACGDYYMAGTHETCIEEFHEQQRNDAAEQGVYIGRECDCGYTYDGGIDAGGMKRPIIKLVYTDA